MSSHWSLDLTVGHMCSPSYDYRVIYKNFLLKTLLMKTYVAIAQMTSILCRKYMRNGLKISNFFVLAITFYPMHIFQNRFHCWSAFSMFFELTPRMVIFNNITCQDIPVIFHKIVIMARLACSYMAITMVIIGVFSKKN